ncbi:DUF502 domain-containing protein [Parapedobacter sp. ISTM3]|uniref:Uncharacterized membrane protein n=1 Tax=Parapedobacter luteus TaxID=623280 RepID=A0A1T5CA90_9SPHI|nr:MULTISPECIES: DUF502 domain-containing protein [Parapedobacter]MBK1439128.1 DUF502 domain-containing protein [Parapedobacter sp. ISTM3]SKB56347.1 Uncharacterized membrane protein [Parapedobacter luteus]
MKNRTIRLFFNYLIKGTLVVVPLAGALFLIVWIVASIDSALNLSSWFWEDEEGRPLYVPGLGILTVITVLVVVGMVFTNVVTEPISNWLNNLLNRIPLFSTLYSSIKDFTEAFVGDAKKFNEPVLVEVNETGLKKIGFLTQRDLSKIGLQGEVIVYFPYSYSFAGQVVVVKSERVKRLNMSATDAMKLVVSGGVSGLE